MNTINKNLKIYQVPFIDKVKIILEHYEFGMPMVESLASAKFTIIDKFADNMVQMCDREHHEDKDFFFDLHLESKVENDLRKFLSEHKKFVFKYITSKGYFIGSHIYQLYLQYIPYELNEVEKSVFLDAYIRMIADLRGTNIANKKRKNLEENLHINQF